MFSKKGWDPGALLKFRKNQQDIGQLDYWNDAIDALLVKNPVRTLYMHPIIYSLSTPKQLPDRLPTEDFTVALPDLLDDAGRGGYDDGKGSTSDKITFENIKKGILKLDDAKNYALGSRLRSLRYTAQLNAKGGVDAGIEEFRNAAGNWFDDTVARGSVWYKRRMQRISIICRFILAVVLNADTVGLTNTLWHTAMLREAVTQAHRPPPTRNNPPVSRDNSNWSR